MLQLVHFSRTLSKKLTIEYAIKKIVSINIIILYIKKKMTKNYSLHHSLM